MTQPDLFIPDPAPVPSDEDLDRAAQRVKALTRRLIKIKCMLRGKNRLHPTWRTLIREMLIVQKQLKALNA